MSAEFNLDLTVLRLLTTRQNYDRYAKLIPEDAINKETAVIVKRMGEFYEAVEVDVLTHDQFWPYLQSRYPNWKQKDIDFWRALTKPLDKPNPPGLNEQMATNMLSANLGSRVVDMVDKWKTGGEIDLGPALRREVEQFESALIRRVKQPLIELPWEAMMEEEAHDVGLHWRTPALQQSTRALRPGDFGILAARPDRGKTTIVAQEITHFAPQLIDLYPGEKRPIIWLNNEGPGRRIMSRIRQSALGLGMNEIVQLGWEKARELYVEAIGGDEDMIRVLDVHGYTSFDIEEIIKRHRPGVVVFDMIDNIRFAGGTINGGERTDQILESMYQWAREQGVVHEFVGLATSQISAEGEGVRFPPQTALKDSRTGKQGACDFIITMGVDNGLPNQRWIGFTKNKIKRQGAKYSPEVSYFFDADRGRLVPPTEED